MCGSFMWVRVWVSPAMSIRPCFLGGAWEEVPHPLWLLRSSVEFPKPWVGGWGGSRWRHSIYGYVHGCVFQGVPHCPSAGLCIWFPSATGGSSWLQMSKALIYQCSRTSLGVILLPCSMSKPEVFRSLWGPGLPSLRFLATHAAVGMCSFSWSGSELEPDVGWFLTQAMCYCCTRASFRQVGLRDPVVCSWVWAYLSLSVAHRVSSSIVNIGL